MDIIMYICIFLRMSNEDVLPFYYSQQAIFDRHRGGYTEQDVYICLYTTPSPYHG